MIKRTKPLKSKLDSFSYTSPARFISIWGVSPTHPVLASFLSREFLLHISCWFYFYLGSFSYTSRAGFIFIWGVSLTHPVLVSSLSGEFLLRIPCWLHFYLGSFSYTSRAASFFFYLGCFYYTSRASFDFFLGSFSYTSGAVLISMQGISYTSQAGFFFIFIFLSAEFLLQIPRKFLLHMLCWLNV